MSESEQVEIGADDVESLAGKLETLFAGLNEREQAILSHVMLTAAESASEVSGFAATGLNAGSALGIAVGLGDVSVAKGRGPKDFSFVHLVDKASPVLFK